MAGRLWSWAKDLSRTLFEALLQKLRGCKVCSDAEPLAPWREPPGPASRRRLPLRLQRNGRDWTQQAFLSSADALGLDAAGDQATKVAIARALTELATHPLAQLRGTRLEEMDFNALLVDWRSCGSASALEASPGKGETPYDE